MNELLGSLAALDKKITDFILNGVDDPAEETFCRLALKVFARQYTNIPLYRGYCDKRGANPDTVQDWQDIPAVPTEVFKVADLTLLPDHTKRCFMTSGTSDPTGEL